MKALRVPVSGKPELVDLDQDHKVLAAAIGAEWIEFVRTPAPGVAMLVDEDGIAKDRPVNPWVSGVLYPGPIVGNVLLVGEVDGPEGLDCGDVPAEAVAADSLLGRLLGVEP